VIAEEDAEHAKLVKDTYNHLKYYYDARGMHYLASNFQYFQEIKIMSDQNAKVQTCTTTLPHTISSIIMNSFI
jgi:hypothetical protein